MKINRRGQGLIEVVVGASILAFIVGLISMLAAIGIRNVANSQVRQEATFLAQQGVEAVTNFKDRSWGTKDDGTDCTHTTCDQLAHTSPFPGRFHDISSGTAICVSNDASNAQIMTAPDLAGGQCSMASTYTTDSATFTRRIVIENADGHPGWELPNSSVICPASSSCKARRVIVQVKWTTDPCTRVNCVELVAYLSKWKEQS